MTTGFWKHKRFKDVFIFASNVVYVPMGGGVIVTASWWNRNSGGKPFPMGISDEIKIKSENIKDWINVGDPNE